MGIPKGDLLGMTVAVLQTAGFDFWQYELALSNEGIPI